MDIYKSVIVGVVSGILTTALIWLVVKTFIKIVIPWYQSIIYRGIDLNGDWFGIESVGKKENFPKHYEHSIDIKQTGHVVKGSISVKNVFDDESDNSISEYIFQGEISDNYLLISYSRKNRTKMGMGAYLLKVTGQGDFLIGSSIFMNAKCEIHSVNDIILERKNN